MNSTDLATAQSPPAKAGARRFSASVSPNVQWICFFLALALIIGFLDATYRTIFILRADIITLWDGTETYAPEDASKYTPAVILARTAVWALVFAAVILSFAQGNHRIIPNHYIFTYFGMWGCSVYLLIGLTTDPLGVFTEPIRLFSKLAPGVLMSMGLFFLGANPYAWERIWRLLMILVAVVCLTWIASALQMTQASRHEAYRWIFEPGLILEVTALLPIAVGANWRGYLRYARFIPLCMLAATVILEQGRLVLVLIAIQVSVYLYLRTRAQAIEGKTEKRGPFIAAVGFASLIAIGLFIVWPLANQTVIKKSAIKLYERRTQDTRTGQLGPFFEKATWDKMLLGAGYPAENEYNGEGEKGIDSGYLNSMYVCGLPMMIFFVAFFVAPVLRAAQLNVGPKDAAVIACVFAYVIRLTSSTVPEFEMQFLIATLMAGRCAWLLQSSVRIENRR